VTTARWQDRSITGTPLRYTLVTTEEMLHKELRRLGVPRGNWPYFTKTGVGASAVQLEDGDGRQCAIIIVPPIEGSTGPEIASRIVHEAMHLWRWTREIIGEDQPSSEFEAYAMENICRNLFEEYARQTQHERGGYLSINGVKP